MSMNIAIAAVASFVMMFVVQMIAARLYRPKSEDKFIFTVFTIVPALIFICLIAGAYFGLVPLQWLDVLLVFLLYFVISASWVATYPAVYSSAPTLVMSYIIHRQPEGTRIEDFEKWMALQENSADRIHNAMESSLICQRPSSPGVELTSSGRMLFCFFTTYKKFLAIRQETL